MGNIRTYKRKLIINKAKQERVLSWIGACRLVYNMGLEIKTATYKATGKSVHKYELMKQIAIIRKEYDWMMDVPSDSMQSAMEVLENSFGSFFRGGGYPKFASKKTYKSIRFKQRENVIRAVGNHVNLPKLGMLRMVKDSPIIGDIKNAYLKIEPTGFFICIQCDNVPAKFVSDSQAVGLDMGLSHFCVDSNGNFIANPKHFKKYERKLCIENRSLARKKRGSNRWKNQVKRLALLHHKISNVRKDFLHKESTIIAKRHSSVYMEDLNISGLIRNAKLSKHILDAGWGMFKTMLEYKTTVVKVDARYTSQSCSSCGHVDSESRKSQSKFDCTKCGHKANADHNAALNILSRGTALDRKRSSIGQALVLEPDSDISAINSSFSNYQSPIKYNVYEYLQSKIPSRHLFRNKNS